MGQKLLPRVITLINGDGRPITCFNSSFQTLIYLDFSLVIEKINEMNSNFFKVEEQVYVKNGFCVCLPLTTVTFVSRRLSRFCRQSFKRLQV